MLEPADHADVVVVGAGAAGLSAALQLTSAGVHTIVLEAAPYVGGRMATERKDGFRLDRIGRLLCSSYPELRRTPGLDGLVLHPFSSGLLVYDEGGRHRVREPGAGRGLAPAPGSKAGRTGRAGRSARGALTAARALASAPRGPLPRNPLGSRGPLGHRSPRGARSAARPPFGGPLDQARLGAALSRLAQTDVARILGRPELPAAEALLARGLPARTVDGLLRPLLAALLCDPDLSTSSRCVDLALRGLARGRLCVPEGGAAELPERMAAALPPGTVHTGVKAVEIATNSVRTADHGEIRCRAVVLATGARQAAELLPGLRLPGFHPVTVVHHTAISAPATGTALLLAADRSGPVAHTAVMSEVDPARAPRGRSLITSVVLGAPPPEDEVRAHLARLYGTNTTGWELLAMHHDPEAVPAMPAPHDPRRAVRLLAGLYVCGDHRDTGTVQGALHSGRRAARSLLRDWGVKPAREPGRPVPVAA